MDTKTNAPSEELLDDEEYQKGYLRGFDATILRDVIEVELPLYRRLLDRGFTEYDAMKISWITPGTLESEKELEEYIKEDPNWGEEFRLGYHDAIQEYAEIWIKGSPVQRMYLKLKESGKFTDEEIVEMTGIEESEIPYAEELLKERLELLEKNKVLREQ